MAKVQAMLWYVVHTHPKAEATAFRHLVNQEFDCFLPRVREVKRHARQIKTVLVSLFPRYLFVRFDLNATRWRAINGTRGVASLIISGSSPVPVPPGVVDALLNACDEGGVTSFAAVGLLAKGRRVRIKSGAFRGQTGEVAEIFAGKNERVHVLLTLLGVDTRLQLPAYAVEAA